ncbi:hypothetical protein BCV70DRAFT_68864 [Testicularia cyperi]|uniref:Alpha/beta-hydrolase n=1 Tax=Testicularia cyperi TaxID=1882483 RepID=A0A317XGR3_9BASI|nr:hypothetical protein BCV70DRAFT_68864 [Testicularia cyperi]
MKWNRAALLVTGLVGVASAAVSLDQGSGHGRPSHLERRQDQAPATEEQQYAIYRQAFSDPVGAAKAANALPYMANQYATGGLSRYNVAGDNKQLPWNSAVPVLPIADVNGSVDGGWQEIPDIQGMTLNRSTVIGDNAVMPFYISQGYDASKIKRVVMVMPGKPRDSWKYTSLIQDALAVQLTNSSSTVSADEVLIIGPCWMNQNDHTAGAIRDNELYWTNGQWQSGMASRGPGDTAISSYEVMDFFLDMLFDQAQFPQLKKVVIAGHSMGAQMVQRYAVLKKPASYDPNVAFWIGNPGSYVWVTDDRPNSDSSCSGGNDWAYGLSGSGVPNYGRDRVQNDKDNLVAAFRARNVHYNYGLLDNGQGDTRCQAAQQGANHLERGCKFVESLAAMSGGFPATHTANFMPNVSHVDYSMLSYNISLWRLFDEDSVGGSTLLGTSSSPAAGARAEQSSSSATATLSLQATVLSGAAAVVYGLTQML